MTSVPNHRWAVVLAVAAALCTAALGAVLNAGAFPGVDRHTDGSGPLGSGPGGGANSLTMGWFPNDPGPWTVGYELCLVQGTDPAIIERVSAARSVGSGLNLLGAAFIDFGVGTGGIGDISGYPPKVPETLHPAIGFAVTQVCPSSGSPPRNVQLVVGVAKPAGSHGGGWENTDIAYRVGTHQYVVTVNQSFYACGQAVWWTVGCNSMGPGPYPNPHAHPVVGGPST
jgi:hypothetical protein